MGSKCGLICLLAKEKKLFVSHFSLIFLAVFVSVPPVDQLFLQCCLDVQTRDTAARALDPEHPGWYWCSASCYFSIWLYVQLLAQLLTERARLIC